MEEEISSTDFNDNFISANGHAMHPEFHQLVVIVDALVLTLSVILPIQAEKIGAVNKKPTAMPCVLLFTLDNYAGFFKPDHHILKCKMWRGRRIN